MSPSRAEARATPSRATPCTPRIGGAQQPRSDSRRPRAPSCGGTSTPASLPQVLPTGSPLAGSPARNNAGDSDALPSLEASPNASLPPRSPQHASPSVGRPVPPALDRGALARPPRAIEDPLASVSPQRAATIQYNRLAPWEKSSTWRAMRSDQVDNIDREVQLKSPARAQSREATELAETAARTAHGSVPGTFFTRMLLRGNPPTQLDHRGLHMPVASKRRIVEAW